MNTLDNNIYSETNSSIYFKIIFSSIGNSGIFTLDHELINEMKKDLMDKKGASKKEANRAFIKAYKNLKGSVFYG